MCAIKYAQRGGSDTDVQFMCVCMASGRQVSTPENKENTINHWHTARRLLLCALAAVDFTTPSDGNGYTCGVFECMSHAALLIR